MDGSVIDSVDGYLSYASVMNMKVVGGYRGNESSVTVQSSPATVKGTSTVPVGLLALDRHSHLNVLAYLEPIWWHIDLLEWIRRAGCFSDESKVWGKKRFEPRHPKSKEDLLALTALRLNTCNLSGKQRTHVIFVDVQPKERRKRTHYIFLDCNRAPNLS
jgi:hypothetical protein